MTKASSRTFYLQVTLYAILMAALVLALKYLEYRYTIRNLSVEIYIGLVAGLFSLLGIWVGTKLIGRKKSPTLPIDQDQIEALGISPRELDVLQLIAEGLSNQEIADRLFISLPTVKTHSSRLFEKLRVQRRTQATIKTKALGIIR